MGLVATRRWCATVRRGRHTKSTRGYSGHVTATQEEEEEEVRGGGGLLPSSFNGPVLLVFAARFSIGLGINWLTRRHSLAL